MRGGIARTRIDIPTHPRTYARTHARTRRDTKGWIEAGWEAATHKGRQRQRGPRRDARRKAGGKSHRTQRPEALKGKGKRVEERRERRDWWRSQRPRCCHPEVRSSRTRASPDPPAQRAREGERREGEEIESEGTSRRGGDVRSEGSTRRWQRCRACVSARARAFAREADAS